MHHTYMALTAKPLRATSSIQSTGTMTEINQGREHLEGAMATSMTKATTLKGPIPSDVLPVTGISAVVLLLTVHPEARHHKRLLDA